MRKYKETYLVADPVAVAVHTGGRLSVRGGYGLAR